MSRTKRKTLKGYRPQIFVDDVGDAQVDGWHQNRKMKPYAKQGSPKFQVSKTDHVGGYSKGVSHADKLITRNANRSFKKGYRQQLKQQLKQELDEN